MNKMMITLAAVVVAGKSALAASYSGTCTSAYKEQWMTEAAVQAKITEAGYTVKSIRVTRAGNCSKHMSPTRPEPKWSCFLIPPQQSTSTRSDRYVFHKS